MLYVDKFVSSKTGLTFTFDTSGDLEEILGVPDTHDKSDNWNDREDGLWDRLVVNETCA